MHLLQCTGPIEGHQQQQQNVVQLGVQNTFATSSMRSAEAKQGQKNPARRLRACHMLDFQVISAHAQQTHSDLLVIVQALYPGDRAVFI